MAGPKKAETVLLRLCLPPPLRQGLQNPLEVVRSRKRRCGSQYHIRRDLEGLRWMLHSSLLHSQSRRSLSRIPYVSTDLLPPKTGPAPLTTFQKRLQCPRRLGLRGSRRFQTEVPLRLPPISSILSLTAHGLQALTYSLVYVRTCSISVLNDWLDDLQQCQSRSFDPIIVAENARYRS